MASSHVPRLLHSIMHCGENTRAGAAIVLTDACCCVCPTHLCHGVCRSLPRPRYLRCPLSDSLPASLFTSTETWTTVYDSGSIMEKIIKDNYANIFNSEAEDDGEKAQVRYPPPPTRFNLLAFLLLLIVSSTLHLAGGSQALT